MSQKETGVEYQLSFCQLADDYRQYGFPGRRRGVRLDHAQGDQFLPGGRRLQKHLRRRETYGGELSFALAKGLEFWIGASTFSKTGKTSYMLEETKLSLIPISGGLKLKIMLSEIVSPYIAVGAEYALYKESNAIGDVNAGGVGFIGKGGLLFQVADFFGIDAHVAYSSCSIKGPDFTFDVGGLEFGAGLVFIF